MEFCPFKTFAVRFLFVPPPIKLIDQTQSGSSNRTTRPRTWGKLPVNVLRGQWPTAVATLILVQKLQRSLKVPSATFRSVSSFQQTIGLHVLLNAEMICDHFLQHGSVKNLPKLSPIIAQQKRAQMLQMILDLSCNEEKKPTNEDSVKLKLVKVLQKLHCASSKNATALTRIPWNHLNISGVKPAELKQHLNEILKMICHVKTLIEILADNEKNERKLTWSLIKTMEGREYRMWINLLETKSAKPRQMKIRLLLFNYELIKQ